MEPRSYTTVDKSAWGDGPWQSEPDKMQWRDETTGLVCLIVRGPLGALCGYVGVPEKHPAYGLSYDGTPDEQHQAYHSAFRDRLRKPLNQPGEAGHEAVRTVLEDMPERPWPTAVGERLSGVDVHGGLTFAGGCHENADPAVGICHVPDPDEPDSVWWFGFDCIHAGDLAPKMELDRKAIEASMPPTLKKWREENPDQYRTVPYVQAEVAGLAKQLAAIRD